MLRAQEFKVFEHEVQTHGWFSQGFVNSNDNNWMSMKTSSGVGSLTDMGMNLSSQLTDKLYVGAQVYSHNSGQLGQWHPTLDWAVMSYRFKPWFGIRGGKVKTAIGLYNDTQDQDFLHPFALLPQSIYPVDLRDSTIAHVGGDIFGDVSLPGKWGTLSYNGYAGHREDSKYGGYPYLLAPVGIHLTSYGGLQYGADLRWKTPLKGLLVGASRMNEDISGKGSFSGLPGIPPGPYSETSKADWINQFYLQYSWRKLEFDAEYRRYWRDQSIFGGAFEIQTNVFGGYASLAYRFTKWLQLGSYYSQYYLKSGDYVLGPADGHTFDKVVTARFDFTKYVNAKVEGHFMNGIGVPGLYPDGFYTQVNATGFKPNTNALVVRTGFNF
jgi:hypothetical protein